MGQNELNLDPPIMQFTIFSGGGGLVHRKGEIGVKKGTTELRIRGVPASFSQESFMTRVEGKGTVLRQVSVKKPTRQYVEDTLQREGSCAQGLIQASTNLGARRADIIEICEEVAQRSYHDEEAEIIMTIEAEADVKASILLSYFIDDPRFMWTPFISVETDTSDEAMVEGYIEVRNSSPIRFEDVEVAFADFTHTTSENAYNERLDNKAYQNKMKAQRMNVTMFK
jgi:hypothetical protein